MNIDSFSSRIALGIRVHAEISSPENPTQFYDEQSDSLIEVHGISDAGPIYYLISTQIPPDEMEKSIQRINWEVFQKGTRQ